MTSPSRLARRIATALLGLLLLAGTAPGAAALVVRMAELQAARPGGRATGRVVARLRLTAADAGPALPASLLAGGGAVRITNGAAFDVVLPIGGCRASGRGRVVCNGAGGVFARLERLDAAPYVYELSVLGRRVDGAAAGAVTAAAPVLAALYQSAPAERVGSVGACTQTGQRRLRCTGTRRPNFVFIVTDDQRWDTLPAMPALQALAATGVRFTNAFTTTPLCGPSRAAMLTGRYARHTGVYTNDLPAGGAVRFVGTDASTLATWLHDAGYLTGMYGKYLTGYYRQCPQPAGPCYVPPGWDEWHVFRNQGYYNYYLAENGIPTAYGGAPADYSTDVLAAKVVDLIATANGQPFFVHLGIAAPHSDGGGLPKPAPRHAKLFGGVPPWRPAAYDEADFADKPLWMQSLPRAADALSATFTFARWTDLFRIAQLNSLRAADEAVAAILAAVAAAGEADNTVVVFTSDNGLLWGEHRAFAGKSFAFEESIRVPLVVHLPAALGVAREESALALAIDVPPTLAALAGVVPPTPVDGRSLVPLLRGERTPWRDAVLLEHYRYAAESVPTYAGVRTADWKYVEYPESDEAELYDLRGDPAELANLAADPSHAATRAALAARLAALTAGE